MLSSSELQTKRRHLLEKWLRPRIDDALFLFSNKPRSIMYGLVLQHVAWEGLGLFEEFLRDVGVKTTIVKLYENMRIPFRELRLGKYSCAICLGSPSTAYIPESNPNHYEEVEFFRAMREKRVPSFNICYSMQLFSVANGGRVMRNPKGKEVGIYELQVTDRSDPVFGFAAPSFRTLQWHSDHVVELPEGSVRLAFSDKTENQIAVTDGIHYLVQGDGQAACVDMVKLWLKKDRTYATEGTGVREEELLADLEANQKYFRDVYREVLSNFIKLCT